MARSRTGGSSGLLSGKLGDVIYSITRNSDGSFRQQISANPEFRENPNTDAQARARCTMGTIERAMFTFSDFMGTGFEGVASGTLSVSEFSKVNYNAIKEYLDYMWDFDVEVDNYWNLPKKGQTQPRAGQFILSRGSLRNPTRWLRGYAPVGNPRFSVQTMPVEGHPSVASWLEANQLQIGEQLVFVFFEEGRTPSLSRACYFLFATEQNVNPNTLITRQNFKQLFTLKSNVGGSVTWDEDYNRLLYLFEDTQGFGFRGVSVDGIRRRRQVGDRLLYSTCELSAPVFEPVETWGWQTMKQVKKSWQNAE